MEMIFFFLFVLNVVFRREDEGLCVVFISGVFVKRGGNGEFVFILFFFRFEGGLGIIELIWCVLRGVISSNGGFLGLRSIFYF